MLIYLTQYSTGCYIFYDNINSDNLFVRNKYNATNATINTVTAEPIAMPMVDEAKILCNKTYYWIKMINSLAHTCTASIFYYD